VALGGDGVSEQANIVGNVYDKYGTKNPIARSLMKGFLKSVTQLYEHTTPKTVLEVGCGEGELAHHLLQSGHRPNEFQAVDISLTNVRTDLDELLFFRNASIYELPYDDKRFDLVVCCEVLEHLERPADGLAELARVARKAVLLSTPWEPVWRMMNVARFKYVSEFGNTPGHIQHFSRSGLIKLAKTKLQIIAKRTPLPWTVLLGEPLP
jgi:ubiquinone/menaquinone biosynthesis C-methylase UbiE